MPMPPRFSKRDGFVGHRRSAPPGYLLAGFDRPPAAPETAMPAIVMPVKLQFFAIAAFVKSMLSKKEPDRLMSVKRACARLTLLNEAPARLTSSNGRSRLQFFAMLSNSS